jgi:hypothetical protein
LQSDEERSCQAVRLIYASQQAQVIRALEEVLTALASGAASLRYMRMHPGMAEEATQEFLLRSIDPDRG